MDPDNFIFAKDATSHEKLMFFIATHNILTQVYSFIYTNNMRKMESVFGSSLSFKLLDFRHIWEKFIDQYRVIIERNIRVSDANITLINQILRSQEPFWYKLGEKFISENFLYIGEIVNEMSSMPPCNEKVLHDPANPGICDTIAPEHMIVVRKLVIAVNLIFKHSENRAKYIVGNPKLCKIVDSLKGMFIDFLTKHKKIIDPYFQDYGPEVYREVMDFDQNEVLRDDDGSLFITPMDILTTAIKAEMFNHERHDRLLQGVKCEILENRVFIFKELGELFINDNLTAISSLARDFLREVQN